MCGRYELTADSGALVDHFEIDECLFEPSDWRAGFNIAPGRLVPVVRSTGQQRQLLLARWGLVPHWSSEPTTRYSTINARAETVAEKPAYRDAFKHQRCLIPATGFYEWAQRGDQKIPYHIGLPDGRLFAFAGLWDHWHGEGGEPFDSCTVIVTAANRQMQEVHARMPVIMSGSYYGVWMNPAHAHGPQLQALLQPFAGDLKLYPVSRRVNNPRNDDPRCLEPVATQRGPQRH